MSNDITDFYKKPFIEQLPNTVVSMDIDTTRFTEFVWAYRAAYGFDTGAFIYSIAGSHEMKIDGFVELFKKYDLKCQFKSSIVWRAILMNPIDPNVPELVISLTHYNMTEPYSIVLTGNPDLVAEWEKYFLETFQAPSIKKVAILTGLSKDGSFRIHNRTIQEETSDIGYDGFYPFIEGGLKKLAEDYESATETIMLLIGPWGSGKSTLARSLMLLTGIEHFGICNNQMALESPEISDWINSFENNSLVVLEDADHYIRSREDGNTQMSALLNLADGIIKSRRKIIVSTNLSSVNNIDEALVRPGRTFKIIQFRKLTIEEANAARAEIKLPSLPTNVSLPDSMTLAEALNYERSNNVHTKVERISGFAAHRK